jgi:hypothetical protein
VACVRMCFQGAITVNIGAVFCSLACGSYLFQEVAFQFRGVQAISTTGS